MDIVAEKEGIRLFIISFSVFRCEIPGNIAIQVNFLFDCAVIGTEVGDFGAGLKGGPVLIWHAAVRGDIAHDEFHGGKPRNPVQQPVRAVRSVHGLGYKVVLK